MARALTSHRCHARGCTAEIHPRLLMCAHHWRMVPEHLKAAVWNHYRKGQEVGKNPSRDYLNAAQEAVVAVATREGKLPIHKNHYPNGMPLYWRHAGGTLQKAVNQYINGEVLTLPAFRLLQAYMVHFIDAPCWQHALEQAASTGEDEAVWSKETLVRLRSEIRSIEDTDRIRIWLMEALEIGIDPL